ncbi:MAG: DNA recombination/repair protein RecA, partial [Candidatus Margulisiibacteriota bacterium]
WYAFEGERLGQGYEQSMQFLKDHSAVAGKIESRIRKAIAGESEKPAAAAQKKAVRPQARA